MEARGYRHGDNSVRRGRCRLARSDGAEASAWVRIVVEAEVAVVAAGLLEVVAVVMAGIEAAVAVGVEE